MIKVRKINFAETSFVNFRSENRGLYRSQIGVHLLFWSVYVLSEYFANLMHLRPDDYWPFWRATFLSLPTLILASYFIAWYVVPKYLKSGRWLHFLIWIAVIGALVFIARLEWRHLVNYLDYQYTDRIPASKVVKNVIRDYSIIALAVCVSIISDYWKKQRLNEKLAQSKAEAEIKLLKGQLHPHFLFNSLNNIYSLALLKSDQTADSILKLTELLDYLIYRAGQDKVPLSEEVELLKNYIGLEHLRYGERLKTKINIQVLNKNLRVAPLILLPFAENCFKHGGPGTDGNFRVSIHLETKERELFFQIANSKKGRNRPKPVSGGIGLRNIRQRLHLLYPGRHQLNIREEADRFYVDLKLKV